MLPQDVSQSDYAFPVRVSHLMPKYEEIPDEFTNYNNHNKWQELVSDWFFSGIAIKELKPKEGIDPQKAIRHVKTILGSFEPKHEHKEAACAYLLSLWFDDIKYERAERKSAENANG